MKITKNNLFNPNGRIVITLNDEEKKAIDNEFGFLVISYDAELDKSYFAFQKKDGKVESTDSVVYYDLVTDAFDRLRVEIKRLWNKTTAELFN